MKPLYVFMAVAATGGGALISANNLHLNNKFSQLLVVDSLYVLAGISLLLMALWLITSIRKKRSEKGFMTIRQYYLYKSAR